MPAAVAAIRKFVKVRLPGSDDDGQDLLEYAMLCALIAIVALGAVSFVGQTVHNVFWQTIASNF